MSEDGVFINIDGNANRVAAYAFGPKNVLLIVGMNKVVKTQEDAMSRARNEAAPVNAQRFGIDTPCSKAGSCFDCKSPECICCQILVTRFSRQKGRFKIKSGLFDKVTMVVLVVAVCVFAFSLYQLVRTMVPYYSGGKEYDKLKNKAITVQEQTDDPGDVSGDTFKVDFDVLLQENPDTVAWIRFDEPSIISYPVVKSADNKEYLTKTFSANDNKLGAIFMDMKNKSDFSDRNTMIYGHNLKVGGEMFSQLKKYEEESFYKEHPNFYIYTPDGKTRTYTVFSAAVVKDTADQYNLTYATD